MKIITDEKGVSEIIGAMMLLMILVLFLGILQAYEVPKWNKEIEKQQFDEVYNDFIAFRSDLEDVSIKNIPKTSSMHMGIRYPERFMLRNPGQGAYGIITTYPLKINISYNTTSGIKWNNLTSNGVVYQMNGLSEFPKLVYENGIIVKDYGFWNFSDDDNHLTTNDSIFLPLLGGIEPASSIDVKTFNIFPIPQQYYISQTFTAMNISIETRYPEIWFNMSNDSRPAGSKFTVDMVNRKIKITDIYGFNTNFLALPNTSQLPLNKAYIGMIPYGNKYLMAQDGSARCADPGKYVSKIDEGCIDVQPSSGISQFIIQDIIMMGSKNNADLRFSILDSLNNEWKIDITLDSDSNGNPTSMSISQTKPMPPPNCNGLLDSTNRLIDLTSCYRNITMMRPNVMTIEKIDNDILHVTFLIR